MIFKNVDLKKLTGLSSQELANVLVKNPRAYMAVKGAVAEKHLKKLLVDYKENRKIKGFENAKGDFDKDFYVTLKNNKTISLECKNIQVLNIGSKKIFPEYIKFLVQNKYLDESWLIDTFRSMIRDRGILLKEGRRINNLHDLLELILEEKARTSTDFLNYFPQNLKDSGISRYDFSSLMVKTTNIFNIDINSFIGQFSNNPLTIDFQRTRNSTDKDGDTRRQRLYKKGEIDVVGACLFSRTMKWQFIFGHSRHFDVHRNYNDRYANKLVIKEGKWSPCLLSCLKIRL